MIFAQCAAAVFFAVCLPWIVIRVERRIPLPSFRGGGLRTFSRARYDRYEKWYQHSIGHNQSWSESVPIIKIEVATWIVGAMIGWNLPAWIL